MYYTNDPLISKWTNELKPWMEQVGPVEWKVKDDAPKEIHELRKKLLNRIDEYEDEVMDMT